MEYLVLFVDEKYKIDLSDDLNINIKNTITKQEISDNLCRGRFDKQRILDAINECSFTLLIKNGEMIGVACITIYNTSSYGYMWEISYICADPEFKGTGSMLIQKLKEIAKKYTHMLPITIYGLGVYPDSVSLYKRNGFIDNQFKITGGKHKKNTKYKKSRKLKKYTRRK